MRGKHQVKSRLCTKAQVGQYLLNSSCTKHCLLFLSQSNGHPCDK